MGERERRVWSLGLIMLSHTRTRIREARDFQKEVNFDLKKRAKSGGKKGRINGPAPCICDLHFVLVSCHLHETTRRGTARHGTYSPKEEERRNSRSRVGLRVRDEDMERGGRGSMAVLKRLATAV